ncbi:MAG: hypothetical protein HY347_04265 [candidate division NC10 bacterium]|nr:hypothetical protein [candidate division NC10 bacterium]
MALEETSVRVRVVTLAGIITGRMTKPKNVRTLDALNLKGDFFAMTDVEIESEPGVRKLFMAINKRHVISLEEVT